MRVGEIWIVTDPYPADTELADITWRSHLRIDHRNCVRLDILVLTAMRNSMLDRNWCFYVGPEGESEAKADARSRLAARDANIEVHT